MLTNPINLERDPDGPFDWSATSGDPQFSCADIGKLAGGWVRLQATILTENLMQTPFVVYHDIGDGFSEATAHYLSPDSVGRVDFTWKLPRDLKALRVDPVSEPIRFSISRFSLKRISRLNLGLHASWNAATNYPGGLTKKARKAVKLVRSRGLGVAFSKVVSASNAAASNPAGFRANQILAHPERAAIVEGYVQDAFRRSMNDVTWHSRYVPKAPDRVSLDDLPLKLVAFYLPQFHPFPENDAWWGKGFTEWTNVTKAQPQYIGHHQPRLPGELGFYDLRLPEVMRQQIDLAHHYGIAAFCFHHYWFGGKRLMERPVNQFLADPTLDIEFCLCWANENWTRRWDGAEHDLLIAQEHSPEDDIAFFADILPALKDPRYIRVDGKPLLIVYRASLLPDAAATAKRWRRLAEEAGLPGLHLVAARSFDITDPRPFGFDAAVEFPPHKILAHEISDQKLFVNPDFAGRVYDYEDIARNYGTDEEDRFTNFKTVMPSWDNEARRPGKGHVFDGADPASYARWLTLACQTTLSYKPSERLVFINAWNEWAEGAHLEPDRYYGYAYLHATASALRNLKGDSMRSDLAGRNVSFRKKRDAVIILHLYYDDLLDVILEKYLAPLQHLCDLIVTIRPDAILTSVDRIKELFPNVYVMQTENQGRDIRPFIEALKIADELGYEYVCKLHTKKSPQRGDGAQWREALFDSLVGSEQTVQQRLAKFESEPRLGLLAPTGSLMALSDPTNKGREDWIYKDNRPWLDKLLGRLHSPELIGSYEFQFPAGSMYWARVRAVRALVDSTVVNLDEFEFEAGQRDGTLAHAIERIMSPVVSKAGYTIEEVV